MPTLPRLDIQSVANLQKLIADGQQPLPSFDHKVLGLEALSSLQQKRKVGCLPKKLIPAFIFYRLGLVQVRRELAASPKDLQAKKDQGTMENFRKALWLEIQSEFKIPQGSNAPKVKITIHHGFMVAVVPDREY